MSHTAFRICPLCEACCGLEIKVADKEIVSIKGDANDVFSKGYICPKAIALKDLHTDPDRLTQPLIKRDGKFMQASWSEAFDEIKTRLPAIQSRLGKDAIAVTVGNPAAHKLGLLLYFGRLARALGTKNIFSASTLDQMPKQLSSGLLFGSWLSIPVPDIEHTDLLIVIGANPIVSNGSLWTVPDFRGKAKALKARGGKLIVIDPRRTETAEIADQHHFIRPGCDVFFLSALASAVLHEQGSNLGRLSEHIHNLDEAVASLKQTLNSFSIEECAARCAIAAADIRALAKQLLTTPRAVLYGRIGTCTQRYGTVCSWLIDVINIITGHLDTEGGAMFPMAPAFANNTQGEGGNSGKGKGISVGRHHSRVSGAPEVYGELPMGLLCEEIETAGEGQIKALITVASNPVLSAPDGERLAKALSSLDFMVSIDIYLNETTRFADVILPGLSPLEEMHYDVAFPQFSYRNQARMSAALFEPPSNQKAEWEILATISEIMGGPPLNSVPTPTQLLDQSLRTGPYNLTVEELQAAPHGIDLGALKPRIPEVLRTPSGGIELIHDSLLKHLSQAGDEIKTEVARFVVIGRRDVRSNNSWMHNLPTLAKGPFRCTALVHPQDAGELNIQDGNHIRLRRGAKSIVVQAEISDAMMPGVISVPHGWGHNKHGAKLRVAEQRPGANLNELFDANEIDPLSGNSVLSGQAVVVEVLGATAQALTST
jgi:anaerobic selenocysteine-containing dehydrogenase